VLGEYEIPDFMKDSEPFSFLAEARLRSDETVVETERARKSRVCFRIPAQKARISLWCGQSNEGIAENFRERGSTVWPLREAGRFEDFLGLETKAQSMG
jgi:hypothetical protein